jgi:sugar phosphate permease
LPTCPPIPANRGRIDPFIGFLIALYDIAEITIKPLGALLSLKWGEWPVLRLGLLMFSLGSGVYLILNPEWLVLVRLLQGTGATCLMCMGIGCVIPLGDALIGDVSDETALALNLGIAGSYKELGEMAGPIPMGFIGQAFGLTWAFLMVGIAGAGSLICLSYLGKKRDYQPR